MHAAGRWMRVAGGVFVAVTLGACDSLLGIQELLKLTNLTKLFAS